MGQNHAENFSKPTPFFSPKCYDFHTKNRRKTALLSHFQRKTAFSRFTVALFSFYMKDYIQLLIIIIKSFILLAEKTVLLIAFFNYFVDLLLYFISKSIFLVNFHDNWFIL